MFHAFCLNLIIVLGTTGQQVVVDDREPASSENDRFTPSPQFQAWITQIVREQLPDNYEKTKNWGHTVKSFDGVSVRIEDGRLKTHRKFKLANDGEWQMYRVKLVDPD